MAYNQVKSNNNIEYASNNTTAEQSQSVRYSVNVTAVESQSMYSRSHHRDFEWTALDDPSEMTYQPQNPFLCLIFLLFPQFWPILPFLPLMYYNHVNKAKSQKIMITDTHVIYERNGTCCCCFTSSHPDIYHIDLSKIRSIKNSYMKPTRELQLLYSYGANEKESPRTCNSVTGMTFSMLGFNESSDTPKKITDTILQRRPKKAQTTSYTIPHITSSSEHNTISLNPDTLTIDYKETEREPPCSCCLLITYRKDITTFLDGLGSIDKYSKSCATPLPVLQFWSPPVGRSRGGSGDTPEMTAYFPDDTSCTDFHNAAERSRDSLRQ